MSDLDATRARPPAARANPNLAQAKLGSLAARSVGPSNQEGVLDAFAEVFAHIAASAPGLQQPAPPEPERVSTEVGDKDSGDRNREEQSDATSEESADTPILRPTSFVDDCQPQSCDRNESNPLALTNNGDDSVAVAQDTEGSNGLSDPHVVAPGTTGDEFSPDHEHLARDIGEGRKKKSPDDGLGENSQAGVIRSDSKLGQTGVSRPERPVDVNQQATPNADAIAAGNEPAADTGDRRRRRSRRERSEPDQPLGEISARQANRKAAVQLPTEQAGSLPSESISELVAEKPAAPSPEVAKAAAAAITGAPPVGSAAAPKPGAAQNSLGSRSGAPGFTTSLDLTAAPKAETKSETKGTTREGVSETVNRAKLIQRVSRAFQHLGENGGVVRLRLAPAELGTVRIEMRINGRQMDARVVAETEAASNALREHLPDLRSRLESFGMQIESMEIETESGENELNGRFSGRDDGGHRSDQQGSRSRPFRHRNSDSVSRSVSPTAQPVLADASITLPGVGVDLRL